MATGGGICSGHRGEASGKVVDFYDGSIAAVSNFTAALVEGRPSPLSFEHMGVLHQLCRIMVSRYWSARLAAYVSNTLNLPTTPQATTDARWFEARDLADRRKVIQLASWLMADPLTRIERAWKAKAVRYSDLARDMRVPPKWFSSALRTLNRRDPEFGKLCAHRFEI